MSAAAAAQSEAAAVRDAAGHSAELRSYFIPGAADAGSHLQQAIDWAPAHTIESGLRHTCETKKAYGL